MKPVHSFLSLIVLSSMVAAQAPAPKPVLKIDLQPAVASFHVSGPEGVFLGGVILSLSGDLVHYFQGPAAVACRLRGAGSRCRIG